MFSAQTWGIFGTIRNPDSLPMFGKVPNRMVRRQGGVRVPGRAELPCSTEDNAEPLRSGGWGLEEGGGGGKGLARWRGEAGTAVDAVDAVDAVARAKGL